MKAVEMIKRCKWGQTGLSRSTILNKQVTYRKAYYDFDPQRVARFNAKSVERLLTDPGI